MSAVGDAHTGFPSTEPGESSPRVIDILRHYSRAFLQSYPETIPLIHSVLQQIEYCRTPALLHRLYQCPQCNAQAYVYNSCGQRHCPQCSGARRAKWQDQHAQLILPGIDYFQVVFTIPDRLSRLVLGNRRQLYSALLRSAWSALAAQLKQQQIQPAALLVLHTWNQDLQHHPHVHALVPGGGPSLNPDNDRCWVTARDATRPWRTEPSLFDIVTLGRQFRDIYVRRLGWLIRHDCLKLKEQWSQLRDPRILKQWLQSLRESEWNVFIGGPPVGQNDPSRVLKYLTRYLMGGPISDGRILSDTGGQVQFSARVNIKPAKGGKRNRKSNQTRIVKLSGVEFLRRWSLHVLPKGFSRSRFYGGFHGKNRAGYLQECTALLKASGKIPAEWPLTPGSEADVETAAPTGEFITEQTWQTLHCSQCRQDMECIESHPRPSWRILLGQASVISIRGSP